MIGSTQRVGYTLIDNTPSKPPPREHADLIFFESHDSFFVVVFLKRRKLAMYVAMGKKGGYVYIFRDTGCRIGRKREIFRKFSYFF